MRHRLVAFHNNHRLVKELWIPKAWTTQIAYLPWFNQHIEVMLCQRSNLFILKMVGPALDQHRMVFMKLHAGQRLHEFITTMAQHYSSKLV